MRNVGFERQSHRIQSESAAALPVVQTQKGLIAERPPGKLAQQIVGQQSGKVQSIGAKTFAHGARAIVGSWASRIEAEAPNGKLTVKIAGDAAGKGAGELFIKTTAEDGTTVRAFLEALAQYPVGRHFIEASGVQRITVGFIDDAQWKKFQDLYQERTGLRPPDNEPGYNALSIGPDGEKRLTLMVREDQTRSPATTLREGIYGVLLDQLLVKGQLLSPAIDKALEENYQRLTRGQGDKLSAAEISDVTELRGLWKKNAAGDGFEKMPLPLYKELTARLLGNLIARQLLALGKNEGMDVSAYATALFHPDPSKAFSVIADPEELGASYRDLAKKLLQIDYADLLYYGGILQVAAPPHLGFFTPEQQIEADAWVTSKWPVWKIAERLAESIPEGLNRAIKVEIKRIVGA